MIFTYELERGKQAAFDIEKIVAYREMTDTFTGEEVVSVNVEGGFTYMVPGYARTDFYRAFARGRREFLPPVLPPDSEEVG